MSPKSYFLISIFVLLHYLSIDCMEYKNSCGTLFSDGSIFESFGSQPRLHLTSIYQMRYAALVIYIALADKTQHMILSHEMRGNYASNFLLRDLKKTISGNQVMTCKAVYAIPRAFCDSVIERREYINNMQREIKSVFPHITFVDLNPSSTLLSLLPASLCQDVSTNPHDPTFVPNIYFKSDELPSDSGQPLKHDFCVVINAADPSASYVKTNMASHFFNS